MAFGQRTKKRGSGTRDLGLPSHGAGKGSAPRNLSPAFRDRFPESMTGDVPGFVTKGTKQVKTYGLSNGDVVEYHPFPPQI